MPTFGTSRSGNYYSVAATDSALYVADAGAGIKRFSFDGTLLGSVSLPPYVGTQATYIETDSAGNLYYSTGYTGRLNSDESLSVEYPKTPGWTYGIDADAFGNVYISKMPVTFIGTTPVRGDDQIFKYGPDGSLLGTVVLPRSVETSDIAIDEKNGILYSSDYDKSVNVFDISGDLPVFTGSIVAPIPVTGISFDASSGHLLMTDLFAGKAVEMAVDGTVIRTFRPETSMFALDIVAVPDALVPEPSGVLLACLCSLALSLHRRHRC